MSLVDAHCHLNSGRLTRPVAELLAEARAAGVGAIVMAGTQPACWREQSALAREHAGVHPVYGIHPWCAGGLDAAGLDAMLAELARCIAEEAPPVALGETGLDGSRLAPADTDLGAQEASLRAHLALADERGLPVVLHILRAHDRALRVLEEVGVPAAGGVIHSYSGSAELARRYQRLGLHISLCGSVTYPQSRRLRAAAAAVDDARLLLETDSPDQAPHPHRGEPNRPALLPLVAAVVADVRGTTPEALAALTTANAERLFRF